MRAMIEIRKNRRHILVYVPSGRSVFFQVLQRIHDPGFFIFCQCGKHVNPDSLFFTAEIHRNQFSRNARPFLLQQRVDIR